MSLADAEGMDMDAAVIEIDDRFDYGEERWIAVGPVGEAICVLVYTRRGRNVRAISLRPASRKEVSHWRRRRQMRFP